MTWLAPIGLLGLISLIILIIIYIIKPNYQMKLISSTYVWRLSLKYKKRRLPINKLNNILIFLCQVLILTICALLLAQPVIAHEKIGDESERIIIVDASAGMQLTDGGTTRFERALEEADIIAKDTLEKGGVVSVILADADPEFIVQRTGKDKEDEVTLALNNLRMDRSKCTYGSADMDGAIALAEEVLAYNYQAQIHLITATAYIEDNDVFVHNVAKTGEWNAAVLGCSAEINQDNHYEISVDVGCYGETKSINVYCQIMGANFRDGKSDPAFKNAFFKDVPLDPTAEEARITFTSDDFSGAHLYSFESVYVFVDVDDCFSEDNYFYLYGGTRPTIRIQYASSVPNNYFGGIVRTLRENMKNDFKIEFKELKADQQAATEGFDIYIFEHRMPDIMPTDGVVLLVDPYGEPEGSGIRFGDRVAVDSSSTLAAGTPHDLTKYVDSSRITIAKYTEIINFDGYEELAYYNGRPVMLAKNDDEAKIVVWAFDLNYSNLIAMPDFSFLMYNMFTYFVPTTMDSQSFEVGQKVDLTARGTELTVSGIDVNVAFEGKTGQITATRPGSYTVTQKAMGATEEDDLIIENFFVNVPNSESNITKQVDQIPPASVEVITEIEFEDLLFYFAIALVSLLFIEWILSSKKNY